MRYPMRWIILVLATVLGVLTVSACSSSGGSASTPLGVQDFLKQASAPNVVVVDVRTPAEFATGHLQGAINIDVDGSTFNAQISQLDKNATYAVYCHSGRRAGIASDAMTKAGFVHVYRLDGAGIADLQQAGAPLATGA